MPHCSGLNPDRTADEAESRVRVLRETCQVNHLQDSVWIGRKVRTHALNAGMTVQQAWATATAASELVTNAIKFAGCATISIYALCAPAPGIEVIVDDDGPGIADPDAAMVDGFSHGRVLEPGERSPHGKGLGLGAVRRLTDELHLERRHPSGLRARFAKWR